MNARTKTFNFPFRGTGNHQAHVSTNVRKTLDTTLDQILRGTSDANISFSSMLRLLAKLGFQRRVRGDHQIFTRVDVEEILNLQPRGAKCKPYQVKQVRSVILRYRLAGAQDA